MILVQIHDDQQNSRKTEQMFHQKSPTDMVPQQLNGCRDESY